ncbi:MAG: hypothetical protein OXE44_00020 [Nitrospinae bacterium]|nr:hypothetical protein [Nitrospinota bacterium]
MGRSIVRGGLNSLVKDAWEAFECADPSSRVHPAMPILFFGDFEAYDDSPARVVTVGLNPSLHEFPEDSPFRRFPGCAGISAAERVRYLRGLCSYFHVRPYCSWFKYYEAALGGAEASYYPGKKTSTALHTDIGSPVATNPTWSGLGVAKRRSLQVRGGPLWHRLLEVLKPQIVLLSIARPHLSRIDYPALSDWRTVDEFKYKNGKPRKPPYPVVDVRWYEIIGKRSLFVFSTANRKPLLQLTAEEKRRVGELALRTYGEGL